MFREESASRVAGGPSELISTGLGKIGLALRHEAWRSGRDSRLTPTQGALLALLWRRGRPLHLWELAEGLAVTAPTASDSLAALVEKGLAVKTRSPEDGRSLSVRLTQEGEREAVQAAMWSDFLAEAAEGLDEREQGVFLRGLTKMIRRLQREGRIPIARMCVNCRFFRPYAHAQGSRPHHCDYVDAPFGDRELRLDCSDQQPLPPPEGERVWRAFLTGAADPSTQPQEEER